MYPEEGRRAEQLKIESLGIVVSDSYFIYFKIVFDILKCYWLKFSTENTVEMNIPNRSLVYIDLLVTLAGGVEGSELNCKRNGVL